MGLGETSERTDEQLTRNWNELLQELRVTETGVQILTGFLLTVPFSQRFTALDTFQRNLYLVVLCGSVLTTGLVVAPAVFHRVLFRHGERPWLVSAADQCALASQFMMALTIGGVVFLAFDVVVGGLAGWIALLVTVTFFGILWWWIPRHLSRR
ncbi:MAG: DUF6328 family protein [Marmoricola sp.]